MDVAYISALSALGGSIIGSLSSSIATWINQRSQARAARITNDRVRLEDIFKDFVSAATAAYGEATQSNEPKMQQLIQLYCLVSKMRILCTPRTVECADAVMQRIHETYAMPNRTIADLNAIMRSGQGLDPVGDFAESARAELERETYR